MEIPLQLSFRDIPPARQQELEQRIRRRAAKLERHCDHITSCRVAVERPNLHQESGIAFRVRIDLTVPPGGLVLAPPLPRPLRAVTVNGAPLPGVEGERVTIREFPAAVRLEY